MDPSTSQNVSGYDQSGATSSSLLERAKARDPQAWQRVVELYGPLVYQWCRRWGISSTDSQDVVQEVFLAVASGIARFQRDRANSTFRGWLWTIARNEARDHFTRRGKHPCPSGGSGPLAWLHEVPEQYPDAESDSHVSSETTELLQRAVVAIRRDFQERTWQAFWRTTVDGEDTAEVARQLGMTARAVRLAKNRVLRRLRKEFCDLIDLTVIRHERLASTGGDATKPGDPES